MKLSLAENEHHMSSICACLRALKLDENEIFFHFLKIVSPPVIEAALSPNVFAIFKSEQNFISSKAGVFFFVSYIFNAMMA